MEELLTQLKNLPISQEDIDTLITAYKNSSSMDTLYQIRDEIHPEIDEKYEENESYKEWLDKLRLFRLEEAVRTSKSLASSGLIIVPESKMNQILLSSGRGYKRNNNFVGYTIIVEDSGIHHSYVSGTEKFVKEFTQISNDLTKREFLGKYDKILDITYEEIKHFEDLKNPKYKRLHRFMKRQEDGKVKDSGWIADGINPYAVSKDNEVATA
jgi:hypothetical protein